MRFTIDIVMCKSGNVRTMNGKDLVKTEKFNYLDLFVKRFLCSNICFGLGFGSCFSNLQCVNRFARQTYINSALLTFTEKLPRQ